jgi:hypothetical protein
MRTKKILRMALLATSSRPMEWRWGGGGVTLGRERKFIYGVQEYFVNPRFMKSLLKPDTH